MTISQEALEIFDEAVEILQESGSNDSANNTRDAISLLLLAVKKAGGPFPDANGMLAELYFSIGDDDSATRYADLALSQDPELLETQLLKARIALYNLESMDGGIIGALSEMSRRRKLKDELTHYLSLYDTLCAKGMSADHFVYRSNALIRLADELARMGNPLSRKINLYSHVANAPIAKLTYEREEDRAAVKKVRRLAEGRMAL